MTLLIPFLIIPQRMKSVSVWAFHGASDMNVPVRGSRKMVRALKKRGALPATGSIPMLLTAFRKKSLRRPACWTGYLPRNKRISSKLLKSKMYYKILPSETKRISWIYSVNGA